MKYEQVKQMLRGLDNPVQKLELVMDLGAHIDSVPDGAVCHEIVGCASWAQICRVDNRFYAQADSAMVRGILALIIMMIDEKTVDEIKNMDIADEFSTLQIPLGTGRLNGLDSMIRFFKNL